MTPRLTDARTKYGAVPTVVDGRRYSSKAEARRAAELRLLERAGEIRDLEEQVPYPLVVNGQKVAMWIGDFRYSDPRTGEVVVEDVKSRPTMTPVYRLKKKLMLACHSIEILEVTA